LLELPAAQEILTPIGNSKTARKGQLQSTKYNLDHGSSTQTNVEQLARKSNNVTIQYALNLKIKSKSDILHEEAPVFQGLKSTYGVIPQASPDDSSNLDQDEIPYSRHTLGPTYRANEENSSPGIPPSSVLLENYESNKAPNDDLTSGNKLKPRHSIQPNVEYIDRKTNFVKSTQNVMMKSEARLSTEKEHRGHGSTMELVLSQPPNDPVIHVVADSTPIPRRSSIPIHIQEEKNLSTLLTISKETSPALDGDEQEQRKVSSNHLLRLPPPPLFATRSRASLPQDETHVTKSSTLSLREGYRTSPWEPSYDDSDTRYTQDIHERFHSETSVENQDTQYHEENSEIFRFQDTPKNIDVGDLEVVDSSFRFQEASFFASQKNSSVGDQSKVNTFVPLSSESDKNRAAVKDSVAERRRKRARAALQASVISDHTNHSLKLNSPRKVPDDDRIPASRNNLVFSHESSSNEVSIAPMSIFDGYSDDEKSEENVALFSGGSTRSAPKRLLNMKNMIRRVRLCFSLIISDNSDVLNNIGMFYTFPTFL